MPYLTLNERVDIGQQRVAALVCMTPGELTYAIYQLMVNYQAYNFAEHAAVLGAVEAAKLEYYRRKVAPYEDEKIRENGDVG